MAGELGNENSRLAVINSLWENFLGQVKSLLSGPNFLISKMKVLRLEYQSSWQSRVNTLFMLKL